MCTLRLARILAVDHEISAFQMSSHPLSIDWSRRVELSWVSGSRTSKYIVEEMTLRGITDAFVAKHSHAIESDAEHENRDATILTVTEKETRE
jgi:hypothetical protein